MLPEPAYPQTGHGYNTYHHQDYISPKPVPIHETVTHYSNNNSVSDEQFYAYLFQLAASGRCPACVVLGIEPLTNKSSFPKCSMERSIEYGGGWTNSLPLEDQRVFGRRGLDWDNQTQGHSDRIHGDQQKGPLHDWESDCEGSGLMHPAPSACPSPSPSPPPSPPIQLTVSSRRAATQRDYQTKNMAPRLMPDTRPGVLLAFRLDPSGMTPI